MTDVIVLATGGRVWVPREPVLRAFHAVEEHARSHWPGPYRFGLVEGECPTRIVSLGADRVPGSLDMIAVSVAHELRWHVFESRPGVRGWPADWGRYGSEAGPLRNLEMIRWTVAMPAERVCIGFPTPDSRGTWHCMREARTAGIPTWRVYPDGRIDKAPEIPES